jgi:hypothetical protein
MTMLQTVTDATAALPTGRQRNKLRAGWTITSLVGLFLALDCGVKLLDLEPVRAATTELGWPVALDRVLGVIELVCVVLYLVPRTAVLGAILATGLFGGAIASHLRVGDPLFSHVLFGVYLGVALWGGLWLREPRLQALLPLRR